MKKGFLLCTMFFLPLIIWSQTRTKDSLFQILNNSPDDTAKVFMYLEYGIYFQDDPVLLDSAFFYFNKAKELSRRLKYHEGEVAWANQLINIKTFFENLDSAENLLLLYIDTCRKYNLEKGMAITMANLGSINTHKGNIIRSIEYYVQSARYFELSKQWYNLAKALNNISRLYNQQENPRALEYANKSIETLMKLSDTTGLVYMAALSNKAEALVNQEKIDQAYSYYQEILSLARKSESPFQMYSALTKIAEIEITRNNFDVALRLAKQAKDYQEMTQSKFSNFSIHLLLADIYMKIDSMSLATYYATEALRLAESFNSGMYLASCYSTLSSIEEKKGNFKNALDYKKRYTLINDSLSNVEIKVKFAQLEAEYQNEKKEREIADKEFTIALKNAELKKKNTVLLAVVIIGILLFLFAIFLFVYFKQALIIKEKDIIAFNHERDKVILRSRMEGQLKERNRISEEMHDDLGSMVTTILFKTDSLKNQLVKEEDLDAVQVIFNATSELADRLGEVIWTINPENDTIESLGLHIRVTVAEMLDAAGINFEFHFPDEYPVLEIGGDERRSIFLSIKEIVNNAIKHSGASLVELFLTISESSLTIIVSDNGTGFDIGKVQKGNGLKNLKKRIEAQSGTWEICCYEGTILRLMFPVKNVYKN